MKISSTRRPGWEVAAGVVLVVGLASCQPPTPPPLRTEVAGTVTFDGQPIPAGMIFFDPDPSQGHDGPQGYAPIKNGRFDTRLGGRGVRPGPHAVRIQGFDGRPGEELPLGELLFPEFTTGAELEGDTVIRDFHVLPAAPPPLEKDLSKEKDP